MGLRRNAALAAGLLVTATALTLGGLEIVLRASQRPAFLETWSATLHEPDSELGTIPKANATVHHRRTDRHGAVWFDVTYHTEVDRSRTVPGRPDAGPSLFLFGDSFLFGEGLADSVTIPAVLQRQLPTWRIRNYGVRGYGTAQEAVYARRAVADGPGLCILGFNSDDVRRSVVPDRLLIAPWGSRHPRILVVRDSIIPAGLMIESLGPWRRRHVWLMARSVLYRRATLPFRGESVQTPENWAFVGQLVDVTAKNCQARGLGFLLIILPNRADPWSRMPLFPGWLATRQAHGLAVLDARAGFDSATTGRERAGFFLGDGHPGPEYARILAGLLGAHIKGERPATLGGRGPARGP